MLFSREDFERFCERRKIDIGKSAPWLRVKKRGVVTVTPKDVTLTENELKALGVTGKPGYALEFPCSLDALEIFLEDNGLMDSDVGDAIDEFREEEPDSEPVGQRRDDLPMGVTAHKIKSKRMDILTPLVAEAVEKSGSFAFAAVFPVLRDMALNGREPLNFADNDGLHYTDDKGCMQVLTTGALRKRLERLKGR